MISLPILYTQRCVLSKIEDNDMFALHQIMCDGFFQRFLPELYEIVETEGGLRQFLSSFNTYLNQDEGILWGIRIEDRLVGFIAVMDLSISPSIFYAMHPSFRNLGYMTECVSEATDFLFGKTLCSYIQTEIYKDNEASLKTLLTNGFEIMNQKKGKYYLRKNHKIQSHKDKINS